MTNISCTGHDGVTRSFDYVSSTNPSGDEWQFHVTPIPPLSSGDFFEITVKEVAVGVVQVVQINHHYVTGLMKMGIPDAMLPRIKADLKAAVTSSPTMGATSNVFRTKDATCMWDRLVDKGLATYDPGSDIYSIT